MKGTLLDGNPISRREMLQITTAAGLAALFPSVTFASPKLKRPNNILMLVVDDLRPQLGCYGDKLVKSPHIDRFALSAMRFDRAYCQFPQCGPSRCSMLTGIRPETAMGSGRDPNTIDKNPIYSATTTLPAHLTAHGYRTAHFGKIYHAIHDNQSAWTDPHPDRNTSDANPLTQLRGYPGYALPENLQELQRIRDKAKAEGDPRWFIKTAVSTEAADVPDNGYYDGITTDRTVAMLGQMAAEPDRPFFLAAGWYKPHLAFACPKRYWDLYDREKLPLAENDFFPVDSPAVSRSWGEIELRGYTDIPEQGPIRADKQRELIHGYLACTSFIDAQVGRVLTELDRLGLAENTVVVLWGDHGFHLGENGHWTKNIHRERAHHSPLILRVPRMKNAGGHSTALVELVDIYPTLLDAAGVPRPAHELHGQSLMPLLDDPQRPIKTAAFTFFAHNHSMRTDRYRYTLYRKGDEILGEELFDMELDPACNRNVAANPAYAQVKAHLAEQYRAGWRQAIILPGVEPVSCPSPLQ